MGITISLPADTKTPGTAGHTADHNAIVDAVTTAFASAANTAGDTFSGSTEFDGGVLLGTAAPATPASGKCVLYSSSAGNPQVKTDSGLASPLPAMQTDAPAVSNTNPTAFALLSKQWTIPANDAGVGTIYCIEVPFNGLWEASGSFNLGWQLDATNNNFVVVAGTAFTVAHNYGGIFRFFLQVLTTGAGGTHRVYSDGTCSDTTAVRIPANCITLNANNTGSIDTTVSHTLAAITFFTVSNASQTVNGAGSTFKRIGN